MALRRLNALSVLLALATPVGASHCFDTNSMEAPEVSLPTPAGHFYVDNDFCQPECIASFWMYEETNGIAGLQRDDPVLNQTCHGLIEADTLVLGILNTDVYSDELP